MFTIDDLRTWSQHGLLPNFTPPRLAVIGDPVGHSLSPEMHQPALRAAGRDMRYARLFVPRGSVAEALELMAELDFVGINITVPHKVEALEALGDAVTVHARLLGAINTVTFTPEGPRGANTDGPGLLAALEDCFGLDLEELRPRKILIVGAGGGAGRAAALQFALSGCRHLILANRTESKVRELAGTIQETMEDEDLDQPAVETVSLDPGPLAEATEEADVIIHATNLGRDPQDALPVPADRLHDQQVVLDMVYAHGGTALVQAARSAGAQATDGLSLLLHQGALSQRIWFGELPDLEAMRSGLQAVV